ncbi:hypothetical protein BDV37DRAFT_293682 [Aspergillus pseudonomiae]|uniref:Concanavalin A-like lectin/glucanase domain-containing protein n=1 Tax=Aspergillus pseudonomiae TaxID=1506151 RepID=A0A5N7DEG2_9EURO|nr:uncharacterized protein BDV37DRAFT_293682 [Aspergillus pseudonomiae]KAE8404792.1 hypothetical protein BDV37DRAFT_293682 [Aspergillus pseudonomiae]
MVPQAFLTQLLLLLAIFSGNALARRGGGGDSDSDSDSGDDSSGGSGGGSGSPKCENTNNLLSTVYLVPGNAWNWTSQGSRKTDASPTEYDGSYFQGEGQLSYNITGGSRCPGANGELRLLGYAWVGPQPPYPTGPLNPFIVGFKAWESDAPVSEIHTSYKPIKLTEDSVCPGDPDLFQAVTTRGWTDLEAHTFGASDVMIMNVSSDSTASAAVRFNATTASDPKPAFGVGEGAVRLPGRTCDSDGLHMGWPPTTMLNGTVTNTTLELRFVGSVNTSSDYKYYEGRQDNLHIEFAVTFSGQFDSINSTKALNIHSRNQTLAWVPNNGVRVLPGRWWYMLMWVVGIGMANCNQW